jgi:hypothetical protein
MSLRFLHLPPVVRLSLALCAAALAATALLAPTAARAADLLLRVGETTVPLGTVVDGDAVAVAGRLDVEGTVTGNAIAVGGPVHISGHVGGNVRAVGGEVVLDSTAVVGGGVNATGGAVRIAPGAVVHQGAAGPSPLPFPVQPEPRTEPSPFALSPFLLPPALLGVIAVLKLFAGLFLLLTLGTFIGGAWLTAALFPGLTASIADVLERKPGGAGIAGILVWLLIGPAIVLLILSIAGVLLVLVLVAALLVAIQIGISAVAVLVGHRVRPGRIAIEALIGALLLAIVFAVPHLGWLAGAVATTWGTGGVVMAIVERRRTQGPISSPPAAPPAFPTPASSSSEPPSPPSARPPV